MMEDAVPRQSNGYQLTEGETEGNKEKDGETNFLGNGGRRQRLEDVGLNKGGRRSFQTDQIMWYRDS